MTGWWIFTACIGVPGFVELYGAIMLAPYIRHRGGLLPFMYCLLSGIFDIGFAAIMVLILVLKLSLSLVLPLDNLVVVAIVIFIIASFIGWRLSSALISLWFAGRLDENIVRRAISSKLEVLNTDA